MHRILALILLSGLAGPVFAASPAAQLTAMERTAVATVVAEHDRHIALLERMVNVNSGTLNLEGVRAVGDMARAELSLWDSRCAGSTWSRPVGPAI